MAKKIIVRGLIVIVAILAIFSAVVAMQPNTFHIERSTTMEASPAAVFAQANDFRNWNNWSPWAKIDPKCEFSFEGPDSGVGAKFNWSGNDEVGSGYMEIIESKPDERVNIKLKFFTPMEGDATNALILKPEGDKTKVTWTMDGKNDFVGKAFCMFMNMDKMIGDKYEEGLSNLRKIVESTPAESTAEPSAEEPAEAETGTDAPKTKPEPE